MGLQRGGRLVAALAGVALGGAAVASAVSAAGSQLPAPPSDLSVSFLATIEISSHVLHVGDTLTATMRSTGIDNGAPICNGDNPCVRGYSWPKRIPGGVQEGNCTSRDTRCSWKITTGTDPTVWQVLGVGIINIIGSATSEDYYVVNDNLYNLGGHVYQAPSEPAVGVTVEETGQGQSDRRTTDARGEYAFALPRGSYEVRVVAPANAAAHSDPQIRPFALEHDVTNADFSLDVKDHITFKFVGQSGSKTSVNATISEVGTAVNADTSVTTPDGAPVQTKLRITPPPETPKSLICTETGLAFPQLDSGGNPTSWDPFDELTAPAGHLLFTIYAGSEEGAWTVDATEPGKKQPPTATGVLDFKAAHRPSALPDVARLIFNAVVASKSANLQANERVPIARLTQFRSGVSSAQVVTEQTGLQDILLAFLQEHFSELGPTDFGPVQTTSPGPGLAAVEFYVGNQTPVPDNQTAILDLSTAYQIFNAALSSDPTFPAGVDPLPTLASYQAAKGTQVVPGHLGTDRADPLTYFGWPYPPLSDSGVVDSSFFNHCVPPDPFAFRVEVDSPVNVLFTNSSNEQFGDDASGKPVDTGAGFAYGGPHGEITYILPADTYGVAVTGAGAGTAHITVFSASSASEQTQFFSFAVRKGETGTLSLGASGAAGPLQFAGRSIAAAPGVPLRIRSRHPRLRHGHRGTLTLRVTDATGRPLSGALVTARSGGRTLTDAFTNRAGTARLALPPLARGKVTVTATAPSTIAAQLSVSVR